MYMTAKGDEANKSISRHKGERHGDGLLKSTQFLLINTSVHQEEEDGRQVLLSLSGGLKIKLLLNIPHYPICDNYRTKNCHFNWSTKIPLGQNVSLKSTSKNAFTVRFKTIYRRVH